MTTRLPLRTRFKLIAAAVLFTTAGATQAQADRAGAVSLQIAPQPLDKALNALALQSGTRIVFPTALTENRATSGVSGTLGVEQALQKLLAGTGLDAQPTAEGGYTIVQGRTQVLPQVTVTAGTERSVLTEGTGSLTTAGPVTAATGMNLKLRETPQSVSVITRQRMDDQQLNSVADVLEQSPGMHVVKMGPKVGGYNQSITARGYAVGAYTVDGVTTPSQAWANSGLPGIFSMDTAIYDSVAIVRGATGLLTGSGDPSASINLTRKRPTGEFRGSIEAGAGRWDQYRLVADLGGPLNEAATLRARVVGAYGESKSWIERYESDQHMLYGIVEADVAENTMLTLTLEHGKEKSNAADNGTNFAPIYTDGTPTSFSRRSGAIPEWGVWDHERTTVTAGLDHAFSEDWQAKVNYSYTERDLFYRRGMIDGINPDHTAGRAQALQNATQAEVHALDVRINGVYQFLGKQHDLAMGFSASKVRDEVLDKSVLDHRFNEIPVINGRPQYIEPDWEAGSGCGCSVQDTQQSGFYFSTRLRPMDDLSVILGSRWSNWKYTNKRLSSHPGYDPAKPFLDNRKHNGVFVPYAGVVYDLNSNFSVYGSYTEIFKPQNRKDVSGSLLDPEEGKNYEIGLKGEWLNGGLNAALALFETRKDNLAIADSGNRTPEGAQAYIAHDSTKTKGWELELAGEIAPGWSVQGGYTRVLSRDSSGNRLNTLHPLH